MQRAQNVVSKNNRLLRNDPGKTLYHVFSGSFVVFPMKCLQEALLDEIF
ncbi:hypothetical protein HMPREF9087_2239 [Enterococcus casseliflavus ATCC 12755]|uniref:Uncharacterized protein n=1 Tax=Enterococcus casseliflavus ATCC 12755 TaxID=888066 RepID=F0ELE7_ENTCA|nr:hypothetical protein HMPREF9087_2239 [Enterococcus casseliflavus ATCC 12755]